MFRESAQASQVLYGTLSTDLEKDLVVKLQTARTPSPDYTPRIHVLDQTTNQVNIIYLHMRMRIYMKVNVHMRYLHFVCDAVHTCTDAYLHTHTQQWRVICTASSVNSARQVITTLPASELNKFLATEKSQCHETLQNSVCE
jgi:hypothetical protein